MTDPANPFVAPTARLQDYAHTEKASQLLTDARVVSAGAAMQWLGTGWTMFREAPGTWIGIVLVYFVIIVIVSALPIIGMLNGLLSPVFAAGVILACEAQRSGAAPTVGHLFQGFRRNTSNLMLIGVLYVVGLLAVVFVVIGGGLAVMVPFFALGGDQSAMAPAAIGAMVLAGLVAFTLLLPLSFTLWWSPALVASHDMPPVEAMKRSLFACLRNWKALFVYGLLVMLMFIVAIIPLGLGLFAAGPVLAISWWAGYRDIFVE
jgi:uncharacterized membrane protein